MKWEVDQDVVVVEPGRRHEDCVSDGKVTKIGRKWVTVKVGPWREVRFDFEGRGESDHGHRPQIYGSREGYEAAVARSRAWDHFRTVMNLAYSAPKHLSAADIDAIVAKLTGAPKAEAQS